MGFSTIGTGTGGGGGGSAQQVNFSITASTSQTISALYIANSIVDVAGLLVAIQNTGGSAITLTAASGSIVNTASYPVNSTPTTVVVQPNATVVLETNLANLQYYISSYSNVTNLLGGGAGQLVYQSAANTTGFVPTSTAGYMLQSNGTSAPSWVPVAVPNVQGGFAGQILYQTATNATGFVPAGTTGQFLASNGTGAPTWNSFAAGAGVTLTQVPGTTTLRAVRSFTLSCSSQTSGVFFPTWLTNAGITDVDGNQYTLYNDTSSAFTIGCNSFTNSPSWNSAGYFISGGSIILQPKESVNIQTFTAGSSYTVMDTSESQSWGFAAQIISQGALPASTDVVCNFEATNDNAGSFNNTTHAYVIPKTGTWYFSAQSGFTASSTNYSCNIQIQQNGVSKVIAFGVNGSATSSTNYLMKTAVALQCNVGDQIRVTNWNSAGGVGSALTTNTAFTGILCK